MAGTSGPGKSSQFLAKLSDLFKMGESTCVGLSIGSSSIKLVELKKQGKDWRLLHFGVVQLPENSIANQEIMNAVAVSDSLKALIAQIKLKSKKVCSSVTGSSIVIKRMLLDVPNLRELQDQVLWEAEQYLPFEISQVALDYQVLSKSKENKVDVMLVAVKDSVLQSYVTCLEDGGLMPKVMDVDFFALQNLYETTYPVNPAEAAALVDIGATSLKTVVVHAGIPVFTKETLMGGRNLTSEIQRQMNLSYTDAETLKVSGQSGGMPQEVSDLMTIMSENFANEIKKSIDFYNASAAGAPVTTVILAGGSSKIQNLPKTVEETVGLPCQLMNPFNGISYDPGVFTPEYIAAIGPIAAIPVGLALRMGSG